jgi:hypothetical protein
MLVIVPPVDGALLPGTKACSASATDAAPPSSVDTSSLTGTWKGYIEAYSFPSGSDAVTLMVAADKLTVIFGIGPALPPLTGSDPVPACEKLVVVGEAGAPDASARLRPGTLGEGFAYTWTRTLFDGARLRLSVNLNEPWAAWCSTQGSYAWSNAISQCGCVPNIGDLRCQNGVSQQQLLDTGQWVSLSESWLELCRATNVCSCTAGSCAIGTSGGPNFDVVFTSGKLDGTIAELDAVPHNVHLNLAP